MTIKHTPKSTPKHITRQLEPVSFNTAADPLTTLNENAAGTAARILSSKSASMKFLQAAGIATRSGKLSPHLNRK